MDNGRELIEALAQVSEEKGMDKETIFEAIETALVSACKKHYGANANVRVLIDRETGEYTVLATKTVVETVTEDMAEITLEAAQKVNAQCELGDSIEIKVRPGNFGRISAQTAKQVVVQKFRESEREMLFSEYTESQNKMVTGIVQRRDRRGVIVNLGKLEGYLLTQEQIPNETYHFNQRLRVYVTEVKQTNKGPIINLSRTDPEFVRGLFEQEVPEISDGVVEIKSLAREPGSRCKVSVTSHNVNVEAIGACVGQNGQRVNAITKELSGEKIDVILWNQDPATYISAALAPSKVVAVAVNPKIKVAHVVVPDTSLSLAIGKEGQNARLAARLTNWRIDIKSESQAEGTDFLTFPEVIIPGMGSKDKKEAPVEDVEVAPETEAETVAEVETEAVAVEVEPPVVEEPVEEVVAEATPEAPTGEYYTDEYYDDEYYDDEYYDDEYYDDEYYDEYYTEPAPEPAPEPEEA